MLTGCHLLFFFFFNDTATTEIYTLSLHDALPISDALTSSEPPVPASLMLLIDAKVSGPTLPTRSEEHTSELQSRLHLVCRLLLEKKKKTTRPDHRRFTPHHHRHTTTIRLRNMPAT